MTAEQVTELIEGEIAGDWDRPNPHGVKLKKCLVLPPIRKIYANACRDGQVVNLWLVLEEHPEAKSGYEIVFDEVRREFGLATHDTLSNRDVFIGYYGTFLETLDGM